MSDTAIILDERNVVKREELYANLIRIYGDPTNALESTILMDLQRLYYFDDVLGYAQPLPSVSETAADLVQRSIELSDGTTITGMQMLEWVKRYVAIRHAEHEAAMNPPPVEPEPEDPVEPDPEA